MDADAIVTHPLLLDGSNEVLPFEDFVKEQHYIETRLLVARVHLRPLSGYFRSGIFLHSKLSFDVCCSRELL